MSLDLARAMWMYQDGMTLRAIGDALGISAAVLQRRFEAIGFRRRTKSEAAKLPRQRLLGKRPPVASTERVCLGPRQPPHTFKSPHPPATHRICTTCAAIIAGRGGVDA